MGGSALFPSQITFFDQGIGKGGVRVWRIDPIRRGNKFRCRRLVAPMERICGFSEIENGTIGTGLERVQKTVGFGIVSTQQIAKIDFVYAKVVTGLAIEENLKLFTGVRLLIA